ncbi:MAG TPA: pitrilysin family protein [Chthonomonas sp.]|uniref:M16 family metallopeptidase n=1 Tax=Chthonomonas sp. TaxID=2282153 RepID=UPI002B4AE79B|nr:pitrilysin family protein [Chthonomonas sp.]HLI47794.1 pitrilysin family protein [Chthonomonas sp.]
MRGSLCLLLAFWLSVSLARASFALDAAVQTMTLDNGMHVLLQPDPSSHFVAVSLFVRTPRESLPLRQAEGLMVAHALIYGSSERTADKVKVLFLKTGGVLNVLYTPDYVALSCLTDRTQLDNVADMLGNILFHADFPPSALQKALQDILQERQKRADDAYRSAVTAAQGALGLTVEPPQAVLEQVTPDRAQRYFLEHYRPSAIFIAVVGDFNLQQARTDFEAFLDEPMQDTFLPAAAYAAPPPQAPQGNLLHVQTSGPAAYALVVTAAPRVDSPDYPAFLVLQALLGLGHASRLFVQLRDRLGIGYQVGADYLATTSGPFVLYAQWDASREQAGNPIKAEQMLHLLQTQLQTLFTNPPSEAEMERARNMAIAHIELALERVSDRAFLLGWYAAMGLGADYLQHLPERIHAVTAKELLAVAKRYIAYQVAVLAVPSPDKEH